MTHSIGCPRAAQWHELDPASDVLSTPLAQTSLGTWRNGVALKLRGVQSDMVRQPGRFLKAQSFLFFMFSCSQEA